jgi:LysM repeat protein
MRARLRDTAIGVTATLALAGWVAGVPLLLWTWRHNPLPTSLPGWHRITTLISGGYLDPNVIPNTAAVVGWVAWLGVTRGIVLDVLARLRHRPDRASGRLQLAIGRWLSAVTLVAVLFTQRPTAARAAVAPLTILRQPVTALALHTPSPSAPTTIGPPATPQAAPPTTPPAVYTVRPGDSYWRIAQTRTGSGARWRELRDANIGGRHVDGTPVTADSTLIHPGDRLQLPAGWTSAGTQPNPPASVHVVQRGETLSSIAATDLGDATRWPAIYRLNHDRIRDPNVIYPGQALRLPTNAPLPPASDPPHGDEARPSDSGDPAPATTPAPTTTPTPLPPPPVPTTSVPSPPIPAPTTTSTAVPAPFASANGNQAGGSSVPIAPIATGISTLTAAVIVWQLHRRRVFALLRRRPRQRLTPPSPAAQQLEHLLVNLADTDLFDWLDAAQHALGAHLTSAPDPGRILAFRAGRHGVEVLWTHPHPPSPPWTRDDTGTWRLPATTTLDELRTIGADHAAAAPAAVTVGDTVDGPLLVDLETAGSLIIDGPPDLTTGLLTAVTIELAASPWAVPVDVCVVGGPPELAAFERVRPITAADIAGPLAARAATATRPDRPDDGRTHDDDRALTVVVAFDPVDLTPIAPHVTPGSPTGLIVVAGRDTPGIPRPGLVLAVAADRTGRLSPPGLEVITVNTIDPAPRAGAVDLATEPITDEPPPVTDVSLPAIDTDMGAVEPLIDDVMAVRPVEVRILTTAPTVTGWQTEPPGYVATELVVFFATRSRPITPAATRARLYPDGITAEAWRAALSRTRRALGTDTVTGLDHLPSADTGHLTLGPTVASDWDRFQRLRAAATGRPPADRAALLGAALQLIDGTPFTAIPARRYRWADDPDDYLRQHLTVTIHDTAIELAELALTNLDDPGLALEAIRRGLLGGGDNEPLHRLAVRAHLARGDTAAAGDVIRRLERVIHDHDGLAELQPETLALIEHWTKALNPTDKRASAPSPQNR